MSGHVEWDDWGGTGPLLHLAPANGFPPATYRKLIGFLTPRFHVVSLRPRALWPGAEPRSIADWRDLTKDLVRGLRERGLEGVVGVGHSVGGVCTLAAAASEPGLFRAVVALDPVLMTGRHALALRALRLLRVEHRNPMAQKAQRRRQHWDSREEAAASYRGKSLFRGWDEEVFLDYIEHGLTESPTGGYELRFPVDWEARVFETTPHAAWSWLRGSTVPTLVLRGSASDTLLPEGLRRVRHILPHARTEEVPGGTHLFPMEQPEECARRVLDFLGPSRGR